jgi:putative ABC transport system permease protein
MRDGVLVSKETIGDYQLGVGNLLNLRVLDHRDGRFKVVPFHVAGIVQEFPSAPRDSFMVANLAYLREADHAGGPNVVFAKTSDPTNTARAVAAATRADGTIVKNIGEQVQQTASSITTVDLRGISDIEEAFALALAAAAMALFVALAVIERRHEFATMAAVGARLRSIAAFVWTEAALVLIAGLLLAAALGLLLAAMLVAMLQHVFDPPPDTLAIPWAYLGELAGAAVLATVSATAISARRLRRLPLGELLREQ